MPTPLFTKPGQARVHHPPRDPRPRARSVPAGRGGSGAAACEARDRRPAVQREPEAQPPRRSSECHPDDPSTRIWPVRAGCDKHVNRRGRRKDKPEAALFHALTRGRRTSPRGRRVRCAPLCENG